MPKPPERDLIKIIFRNFINSLRPRQLKGELRGTDYHGTKYFEIPKFASSGNTRRERWFEPVVKENFEQTIPAEWESWLRGRRREPPTEEEVLKNLEIINLKKENAAKLDKKYATEGEKGMVVSEEKGMRSFPDYSGEYEVVPGKSRDKILEEKP